MSRQINLGLLYQQLDPSEKNHAQSFFWLNAAADKEESHALYHVGRCYYLGLGVQEDKEQAKQYFIKARQRGSKAARDMLRHLEDESEFSSADKMPQGHKFS